MKIDKKMLEKFEKQNTRLLFESDLILIFWATVFYFTSSIILKVIISWGMVALYSLNMGIMLSTYKMKKWERR